MREHEVPTHVQAEDRVLLGFTFPQVVAVMAVFALSYGAYRYAPVGPSEVRMALAVVLGLVGVAMVVGKIGGRRLPLVAADLLKYRLGARLYAGQVSQLVRAEPASAGAAGEERPRPAEPDGETRRARHGGGCARTGSGATARNAATGGCAGSASAGGRTGGTATVKTTGPGPWRRGIGSPGWAGFRSWPSPS